MLKKLHAIVQCFAVLLLSLSAIAQETSSTLNGHITDSKGAFISGATITIKHEPTGFVTSTQTNSKGLFYVSNLKPGGPYTIKISFVGFKEEVYNDVNLGLGNNPEVGVVLKTTATELKEVTVTSAGRKVIAGSTTIGSRQLSTLPTLGRSLSDFTRLTPQSNNNSFAGSNFRYNNLTIDGAINNDFYTYRNPAGFAPSVFQRKVLMKINNLNSDELDITVIVTWNNGGLALSRSLHFSLLNWQK